MHRVLRDAALAKPLGHDFTERPARFLGANGWAGGLCLLDHPPPLRQHRGLVALDALHRDTGSAGHFGRRLPGPQPRLYLPRRQRAVGAWLVGIRPSRRAASQAPQSLVCSDAEMRATVVGGHEKEVAAVLRNALWAAARVASQPASSCWGNGPASPLEVSTPSRCPLPSPALTRSLSFWVLGSAGEGHRVWGRLRATINRLAWARGAWQGLQVPQPLGATPLKSLPITTSTSVSLRESWDGLACLRFATTRSALACPDAP